MEKCTRTRNSAHGRVRLRCARGLAKTVFFRFVGAILLEFSFFFKRFFHDLDAMHSFFQNFVCFSNSKPLARDYK